MSKHSELPTCWDISQCKRKDQCLLVADEEKPCWEVVKDDNACSFHICADCLVYLAKQDDSIFSEEELCSILSKRQETGFRHYECKLAYSLRHSTTILNNMFLGYDNSH